MRTTIDTMTPKPFYAGLLVYVIVWLTHVTSGGKPSTGMYSVLPLISGPFLHTNLSQTIPPCSSHTHPFARHGPARYLLLI